MSLTSPSIELLDSTLRDGEQTPGVAWLPDEKTEIARHLLDDLDVDAVEVATISADAPLEIAASARLLERPGYADRLEFLCLLRRRDVAALADIGGRVVNLLAKGSTAHCTGQLGQTPAQHIEHLAALTAYARGRGLRVNVYLEDWSRGLPADPDYVHALVEGFAGEGRIMLADTLGVLAPTRTGEMVDAMVRRHPTRRFDFHGHDDYGLATANALAAAGAGATRLHGTVNGLGERTGNASLFEIAVACRDLLGARTRPREAAFARLSALVAARSGRPVAGNTPIVGECAFTHTAGVHADGDLKGALYRSTLAPERFGRRVRYALGKHSGSASVALALRAHGVDTDGLDLRTLTDRVRALGAAKQAVDLADLLHEREIR